MGIDTIHQAYSEQISLPAHEEYTISSGISCIYIYISV